MKFSIITPTIQRQSLVKCCQSVDEQTHADWEHIVVVDQEEFNKELMAQIRAKDGVREIFQCDRPHRNGGNTCRHEAWYGATGDYVLYLDDDNFLAHNEALSQISAALVDNDCPEVAFFPILRHGGVFFPVGTPRTCHVDTANLVVKREIGQWPNIDAYCSDGIFIEKLVEDHQWVSFPMVPPIVNMPTSGFCK